MRNEAIDARARRGLTAHPCSPEGDRKTVTEPESVFRPGLLAGQHAFVAGGTSGINLGIAKAMRTLGAKVSVLGRNPDRAAAAEELLGGQVNSLGIACDVRDAEPLEAGFSAALDRFGPIDILVSGAAGNFIAPATAVSPNAFKTVVSIDLLGTFNVFRIGYRFLRPRNAALVAITAPRRPAPLQVHASAAKSAIEQMVRVLAMEWGRDGFRVNAVSPGPIEGTAGLALLGQEPEKLDRFRRSLPLPIFGTSEDVANTVIFLSSPAARFITGTTVDCDGGLNLGDSSIMDRIQL